MTNKIVGIDLGTTNSAAAITIDGVPTLIHIDEQPTLPSVVGISPLDDRLVGVLARNQWIVAPENTVRSIKRKMGSDETVTMAGTTYSPQEISAMILSKIKQAAESELGQPVERAVITVPAYFNEAQRQATIEAGEIAGVLVERIINEPTAAALAYGLGKEEDLRVLVYDLGGGTFDVSVIELHYGIVDVRATAGNNHLGGDDFDTLLASLVAEEFNEEHGIDLSEQHQAWARLLRAAEEAKIELSSAPYALISLEYIAEDNDGAPLHIRREVQRSEYEDLIHDLLQQTIDLIDTALADAGLSAEDIDRVLLVGGATRTPAVWRLVTKHMVQEPHGEIDPDAAVALGAAIQAGIIAGEEVDAILVDVTPMSLGIETAYFGFTGHMHSDRFSRLISRNTTIPVQKSEVFTTLFPGQDKIQIKVYQGENNIASRNTLLGEFTVEDLESNRDDGLTGVTVNFNLDINGILDVSVLERQSGKQVSSQLKANRQRLRPSEIADSQAKLAGADLSTTVILEPGTAVLVERAKLALTQANIDEDIKESLEQLISNIYLAADEGSDEQLEVYADELIDLLFEVEEQTS
ncbi:MAG: Hsp70 family protein [Chloroflexi bacterium]|nr:Hsp70 family protein [Chloroflexota bacterium]